MSTDSEINMLRKEMNDHFDIINKTLIKLIQVVDKLDGSCSKMDEHINFVETTYETLRSPLDYFTNKINGLRGVDEMKQLPNIKELRK
jgi:archaellum component FlaC